MKRQFILIGLVSLLAAPAVWSFPTAVHLTQNPQFRNEGQEVLIRTSKGTITASTGPDGVAIYQPFIEKSAVKGASYAFETETETDVRFNAAIDQSGARSVRRVACPAKR